MFRILLTLILLLAGCAKDCSDKKPISKPAPQKNLVTGLEAISLKGLDDQQQAQFINFLNAEICPCNCPMSFAECLEKKDLCKPAELLANWAIERLKEGLSMEIMAPALSQEINAGFSAGPQIIDLAGYGSKGDKSAPYTLVEFADFECVHCKQIAQFADHFVKKHPEVRFVYKHFPLESHPLSGPAALAAEAAAEQGRFWDMHHALFGSIRPLTDNQIETLAKKWKLDMPKFRADLKKPEVAQRVESSRKEAEFLGIQGTPAFFFNGRPYYLSTDLQGLELRLAMEKARHQAVCQQ